MKCSLVRDLLPLYIEGDCSTETNNLVKKHLSSCPECTELYEMMEKPLELNVNSASLVEPETNTNQFWQKYYGRLIFRGVGLFFIVYIAIVWAVGLLK